MRGRRDGMGCIGSAIPALLLSVALLGCGQPDPLVPPTSVSTYGFRGAGIDEPLLLGLWIVKLRGSRVVHLTAARLAHVPQGLVVDHVWALRFSQAGNEMVGALRGDAAISRLRPFLHPVSEVTLDPSCPAPAHCGGWSGQGDNAGRLQDWYLIAQCHITAPGDHTATGLEITYRVDDHAQMQTFDAVHIEVDSRAES
jgi:hypothetical protein